MLRQKNSLISLTTEQIQQKFGGQLINDCQQELREVNSLNLAQPYSISFLANPKYVADLAKTKAGLIIVMDTFEVTDDRTYLKHKDVSDVFSQITDYFAPAKISYPCTIHPTAIVGENVKLGTGIHIGAYVVIENNCQIGNGTIILPHGYISSETIIGEDCLIYSHVSIRERCQIGHRCILQSNCVIGSDGFGFIASKDHHKKIAQVGNVILEDDVEIGSHSVIDRARFASTVIGQGTKIDNLVQIAHNVVVGKHCFIAAQAGVAGSAEIGDFVQLGGQCGIVGHRRVGNGVSVSGNSVVNKDVKDGEFVTSTVPALSRREHNARLNAYKKIEYLIQKNN